MVNVMKYIREKKQAIKDYSKKRDFEKDLQRQKELIELKEQKEMFKRKAEFDKTKAEVREMKHPFLTSLAKNIGKNVHKNANKSKSIPQTKATKLKVKSVPFGQNKTRWG